MLQNMSRVFVSYARADVRHLEDFGAYTADLRHNGVRFFDDRAIPPGHDFKGTLSSYLDQAGIVVLLLTQNYINSRYCMKVELQHAVQNMQEKSCRILPLNVDKFYVTPGSILSSMQWTPSGQSITERPAEARKKAWIDAARALYQYVEAQDPAIGQAAAGTGPIGSGPMSARLTMTRSGSGRAPAPGPYSGSTRAAAELPPHEAAASALVTSMATDGWEQVKAALVSLWRRRYPEQADAVGADLSAARSGVIAARAVGDEPSESELLTEWRSRLRRLVMGDEALQEELRRFAEGFRHLLSEPEGEGQVVMQAEVHGPGQVNQAGHDLTVISR